jgi:hypothetical protein
MVIVPCRSNLGPAYVMAINYPNLARRASQLLLLKVRDALAGHARSPRNKRTNLLALQIDDLKSSVARRPQHHNLSTQARTSQSQLQKRISYRPPSSTRPPSVPNISHAHAIDRILLTALLRPPHCQKYGSWTMGIQGSRGGTTWSRSVSLLD